MSFLTLSLTLSNGDSLQLILYSLLILSDNFPLICKVFELRKRLVGLELPTCLFKFMKDALVFLVKLFDLRTAAV